MKDKILKSEKVLKCAKVKKVLSILGAGLFAAASIATFVIGFSYPDMITKTIGSVIGGVSALAVVGCGMLAKKNSKKESNSSTSQEKMKRQSLGLKLVGYPLLVTGVLAGVASVGYMGLFKYGMAKDEKQAIANENHTTIEEVSTTQEIKDMKKDLNFSIFGVSEGMAAAIAGALSVSAGRKIKKEEEKSSSGGDYTNEN